MTLRVLSYNICEGGGNRLGGISEVIRQQRPSAVAIVEAKSHASASDLAHDLEMELVFGEANSEYHVAWLSRLPIRRSENHRLAILAKTLLEIEVVWSGDPVHLFATHLASRHDLHTPAEEIPAILDVLSHVAGSPHVLVGDFNALTPGDPVGTPPHGEQKRGDAAEGASRQAIRLVLRAGYTDCFHTLHPDVPGYTYPSAAPWLRLDYIFASAEMVQRLQTCDIVTGEEVARASDHFPIWAEFR